MQFGAVLPQTEIGAGPDDIRGFADGVAAIGLRFVTMYDHILGADRATYTDWSGPYDHTHLFHEPFVTLGYLAAISQLDLATGVLVLPQRQTALVAKQAAEVAVLSGDRLRLGVGIGWNHVEYEALGEDFSTRGRRVEEQIVVMRKLWTEPVVDFTGRWHRISAAGINPLPQQPVPVWLAAGAGERGLRRVGRVADGWLPMVAPGPAFAAALGVIREAASGAGRDPSAIGIEGRINVGDGDLDRIARTADDWCSAGSSRIVLNTLNAGLGPIDAHLEALARAVARVEG
ncbi:MAG: LLM class F420-dependent oxidoreductase [Acidimicrobiales bacterium]